MSGDGSIVDAIGVSGGTVPQYVEAAEARVSDGSNTLGGYSNKMVMDEYFVYKIPENLDIKVVALILCAGVKTYSLLKNWKIGLGQKVCVIGLGRLDHSAARFNHLCSSPRL